MPTSSIELDCTACCVGAGVLSCAKAETAWASGTALRICLGASTFMMTMSVVSDAQWVAALRRSVPSSPTAFSASFAGWRWRAFLRGRAVQILAVALGWPVQRPAQTVCNRKNKIVIYQLLIE
ncbi:hypothetical protein [Pseudomonas parafulva]|uniref:hypothetical protein n=1 Tax=Pseudomonas parafulva TaxID=157782 RepID=UPI001966E037|nr:hypothetical protein [Pseudomonas parafulva]